MRPPKIIKTRRLILRPMRLQDADVVFRSYASDPVATRYLAWTTHKRVVETRAFLRQAVRTWRDGTEYLWAMILRDGTLIGSIGIRPGAIRAEIGYVVNRAYWGNGYTTEAARALVKWLQTQKNIYRIWATCDVDNTASARVLEKVGMTLEGILRKWIIRPQWGNVPRDCCCYSMVKRAKRATGSLVWPATEKSRQAIRSAKTTLPSRSRT